VSLAPTRANVDRAIRIGSEQVQQELAQGQLLPLGPLFDAGPQGLVDVAEDVGRHQSFPFAALLLSTPVRGRRDCRETATARRLFRPSGLIRQLGRNLRELTNKPLALRIVGYCRNLTQQALNRNQVGIGVGLDRGELDAALVRGVLQGAEHAQHRKGGLCGGLADGVILSHLLSLLVEWRDCLINVGYHTAYQSQYLFTHHAQIFEEKAKA
jgi:hypothetical protein